VERADGRACRLDCDLRRLRSTRRSSAPKPRQLLGRGGGTSSSSTGTAQARFDAIRAWLRIAPGIRLAPGEIHARASSVTVATLAD
jgi:hypothetical protein